jgi:hypothetical protein
MNKLCIILVLNSLVKMLAPVTFPIVQSTTDLEYHQLNSHHSFILLHQPKVSKGKFFQYLLKCFVKY